MNRLYKGYDDIAASVAFKSRLVRTLQTETREETPKSMFRLPVKRRTLAVLIAAAILLLAIGTAAAATILAGSYRSPDAYLGQTKEQREQGQQTVPDVESAIAATKPAGGDWSIVMLPEREDADHLNEWRQRMDQPVYSEDDWGWIREIRPEIDEVLIDGNTLVFNVRVCSEFGNRFDQWKQTGETQQVDLTCDRASFTILATGETVPLSGIGSGVMPATVDETGATVHTECDLDDLDTPFPTEGRIRVTMEIGIRDPKVDSMGSAGLLGVMTYSFEFDASAGADVAAPTVTERPLSGSVVLTMRDKTGREYNERVSLDGVVLLERLSYRSTGVYVSYTLKSAPKDWTDAQTRTLMTPCFESPDRYGLTVSCVPKSGTDDVLMPGYPSSGADGEYIGIFPIFPSDYARIGAMDYEIRIAYRCVASFDGEPADEDWHMPEDADHTKPVAVREQPIAAFDLILP